MRDTRKKHVNKDYPILFGGGLTGNIFKKILSIGFEMETAFLTKLSKIETDIVGDSQNILWNTDTNNRILGTIKEAEELLEPGEELVDEYIIRKKEEYELNVYQSKSIKNNSLKKMENATFLVSNDITEYSFTKKLTNLCVENAVNDFDKEFDILEEKINRGEYDDELDIDDVDEEDEEAFAGLEEKIQEKRKEYLESKKEDVIQKYKNSLYTLESNGKTYKINFLFSDWAPELCGLFSDVEWIFTYYKPKFSSNIILETFSNAINNLLLHLSKLEHSPAVLKIKDGEDNIPYQPEIERKIYHYPNSNIFYLQTRKNNEIDNISITPQMTFGCHVSDLIDIFKELLNNKKDEKRNRFTNIENCVNELIESYNYSSNIKLNNINKIKPVLTLILYKLSIYFNIYLPTIKRAGEDDKTKYLKDFMTYNSRHSNYELYVYLKKEIASVTGIDNEDNINKICEELIIQEPILVHYLTKEKLRKGIFSLKNRLEPTNNKYGDPNYSLLSYFEYLSKQGEDWLIDKGVDKFSTKSPINNDVFLTEVRVFGTLVSELVDKVGKPLLVSDFRKIAETHSSPSSHSSPSRRRKTAKSSSK